MTTENTTVWIRGETYRRLQEKKEEKGADSYNDVIDEALEEI
jgi:predicted CopG family antitoxin